MLRHHTSLFGLSLTVFFLAVALSSCDSHHTAATLNDVETYIQTRPDSALAVIRAIDTTTLTTRSLRARYALLYAIALDKNWIDTTDVGVVMPAVDYYAKHGTADEKMKAYYYLGRIQYNGHDPNSAIISYTQAEIASGESQDEGFKGLLAMSMSDIYKSAHYADKELEYVEKGLAHFQCAKDTAHYNLSIGLLAMAYHEKEEWGMADSLYRQVIELAGRDTAAMRMFLVRYAAMKVVQPEVDPKGAITLLNRLYAEYKASLSIKAYGIYAYASALDGDNKTCDSILSFLKDQPEQNRKDSRYYEYLIASLRGDYAKANQILTAIYSEQDENVDQLLNKSTAKALQDYYQSEALESKHQSEVQRLLFAIMILGLSLIFGAFVFWSIRKREKERMAADNLIRISEETNALLVQTKSQLEAQVEEMQSSGQRTTLEYQSKLSSLQHSYIQLFKNQFDTVSSLCKTYLKNQGKPEEIRKSAVYGKVKDIIAFIGKDKKQQALFEEQINQDLDNIVVRLKEDLGKVSDEDARFICYTIAGFDPNMIATLLNLSLSNVYTKRSRLRDRIRQLNSPYKEEYLRVL